MLRLSQCLALAFALFMPAVAAEAPASSLDPAVLHVQVVLDRLGFSPGVLDGRTGQSLTAALRGFQTANGLPPTGKLDPATSQVLDRYSAWPTTVRLKLSAQTLAGPFTPDIPKDPMEQAKLPALGYRNVMEALAERFHTTPETLVALNGHGTPLSAGSEITFPNDLPASRDYTSGDDSWKQTLEALNIDPHQPAAARVVVSKSQSVLKVYDAADKLVAQFPATMGSRHDPLPIGKWTIRGISTNPKFHYNSNLFWDAQASDQKATLPPGPNGPVGVVWIDLSIPHYGIHGTSEPSTIGRAESHGCVRLTNWDAARLALMVKAGTPAIFEK